MENVKIVIPFSIVGIIILLIVFAIGLVFIFIGINMNSKYNNYEEVIGYYISKEHSSEDLYYLIYTYEINGEVYNIKSNVQTNIIPKAETPTKILYNPNNPSEAIIKGDNNFLIFFGVLWILFCLAPIAIFKNKGLGFIIITEIIYIFIYLFINNLVDMDLMEKINLMSQAIILLIGIVWTMIDIRNREKIEIL